MNETMATMLLAMALLGAPLDGAAPPAGAGTKLVIRDVDAYLDRQQDIRDEFERHKKYAHVDESTKRDLYRAQDRIFALLEGHDSIDDLTQPQMVELYNAQNVVNGVLENAELDREVCERRKLVGSHRVEMVCLPKREFRRMHEENRMDLLAPRNCSPGSATTAGDPCDQG